MEHPRTVRAHGALSAGDQRTAHLATERIEHAPGEHALLSDRLGEHDIQFLLRAGVDGPGVWEVARTLEADPRVAHLGSARKGEGALGVGLQHEPEGGCAA